MTVDLILLNGDIHTMNPAAPIARAMAVSGGQIAALGDDGAIKALAGPGTRVLNAGGRMVLPGLQDAHVHLLMGGIDLIQTASLYDAVTMADLQSVLAAHSAGFSGPLVMGAGWQNGFFGDHNLTRMVLDAVVTDRPCIVYDGNFHNACLNSAACRMAGMTKDTPDPQNGHLVRDATGTPTGMLHEEAIGWALAFLPQIVDATRLDGGRAGMAHANSLGLTGIIDPCIGPDELRIYARLAAAGEMTVRVSGASVIRASEPVADALARLTAERAAHGDGFFRINAAKFFLDGGLENRTAAMIAPYADAAGSNAPLMFTPEQIGAFFTALDAARFQIHVHCIGDRATRAALDGFQAARFANGAWPSLHQIAHVQIVDPADMPRFADLVVMANCQPLWAAWDPVVPDLWADLVGPARMKSVYPFRTLIDAGAPWCISSDFPVTTLNPFQIIETAVTRQSSTGKGRRDPFVPDQRIAVAEALLGYTRNAAAACWRGDETGALMRGRQADFILLDRNILTCDSYAIGQTRVLLTVLGGREVYRSPSFDG